MKKSKTEDRSTLRSSLTYQPTELAFGTSGLRGLVKDMTNLEVYINTMGFLAYVLSLSQKNGGIPKDDLIYVALDLRTSSDTIVPEENNTGEISQAVCRAVADSGLKIVNLGKIPTPALTYYALHKGKASIMITGSHISFDRNGIKFNKSNGEVLKEDEKGILERVATARSKEYQMDSDRSIFSKEGMIKTQYKQALLPVSDEGRSAYVKRYIGFFGPGSLEGLRLMFYQHSAVGRDLLVEIFEGLGAVVLPVGRSEKFVPIDTEDVREEQLQLLRGFLNKENERIDAIVSTDGDSDRPLVVGVELAGGKKQVRFFGGDLVGAIVADFLKADAVVVPISVNDAVDGFLGKNVFMKTRIGSPYVIDGMNQAGRCGKRCVVGWEANGGFLTGSDIKEADRVLEALPSRDAILPILCVLKAAQELAKTENKKFSLSACFARLPSRFSKAGLIDNFPVEIGRAIIKHYSPTDGSVRQADFPGGEGEVKLDLMDQKNNKLSDLSAELTAKKRELEKYFSAGLGFGPIIAINYIDGIRIFFGNGDIAHIRPSGNAPQLRLYAVAGSQQRADEIIEKGVSETDGILRTLERAVRSIK